MKHNGIPISLRKKINRTGIKPCSICNEKHILVIHHIKGRETPNCNHPSNIVDICDNCHRKIHEGKIIIEGWFKTTNGTKLIWHLANEQSLTGINNKPYLIGN